MLTISCKALGRRRSLMDDFAVPPPPGLAEDGEGGGPPSLRTLISHVVGHEVDAFRQRQDRRRLDQLLSAVQIEADLERSGKATPGAADERVQKQQVNAEEAVAAALQAFEDGVYLVAIDGQQQRDLDAAVYLKPDSKLVFIRLTFLAGA